MAASFHPHGETPEDQLSVYNFNNKKGIDFVISDLEKQIIYK